MISVTPREMTVSRSNAKIAAPVFGIEIARRLVGQNQQRLVGQRARDGDALHFAARQLIGPVPGALGQTDELEQFERAPRAVVSV